MKPKASKEKRKKCDDFFFIILPETCQSTVENHINNIYVDSIVRVHDTSYSPE